MGRDRAVGRGIAHQEEVGVFVRRVGGIGNDEGVVVEKIPGGVPPLDVDQRRALACQRRTRRMLHMAGDLPPFAGLRVHALPVAGQAADAGRSRAV